jgi:hypothetical protein
MSDYEPLGYFASVLVLTTFWMRAMLPLRAIAIASNVVFISYGLLAGVMPVLLLHLLLLPMNVFRVAQSWREHLRRRASRGCPSGTDGGHGEVGKRLADASPHAPREQAQRRRLRPDHRRVARPRFSARGRGIRGRLRPRNP